MIDKIGVICQDQISLGFLCGLKARLECEADIVEPPARIGMQSRLTSKNARLAGEHFRGKGVDLLVRFTDADRQRWQRVARAEVETLGPRACSPLVCGVAVNSPEEWLCLDPQYIARVLGVSEADVSNPGTRQGTVKRALSRLSRGTEDVGAVVARIVRDVPGEVFRRWLNADGSLRTFYDDCRAAAKREQCEIREEQEASA